MIPKSGEYLSWAEFSRMCAFLNLHMRNNLLLLLPVCHAMQMVYHIDLSKNAPFNVFIASKSEIEAGFIGDTFLPFYKDLVEHGDVLKSFDNFLSDKMLIALSEKIFLVGLARYFRKKCLGKGGKERQERLLSEILNNIPNNRINRRTHRARIKSFIKPKPEIFERYVNTFLCGRRPHYTYRDVLEFARIP